MLVFKDTTRAVMEKNISEMLHPDWLNISHLFLFENTSEADKYVEIYSFTVAIK